MAKTDAEVKQAVYTVIGALMDAGWVLRQHGSEKVQEMGAVMLEEAVAGEVWVLDVLEAKHE